MLAAVSVACEWVGGAALLWLCCWVAAAAFHKLRPQRLLDRLHTRAVLITGCDSGFGQRLARRLDALGVPVLAGCLLPQGQGARSLAAACSSRLRVLPLDVTSGRQVDAAVAAVRAALASAPDGALELWAVVNNAGTSDFGGTDIVPVEKYQKVWDVNTLGAIRVTKAFLPLLKKSKGRVVNIASPAGRLPVPYWGPYCISKSALLAFSDVLRLEVKKWSVSVCTIEPALYGTSIVDSDFLKANFTDNMKKTSSDEREGSEHQVMQEYEKVLRALKWFSKQDISDMVEEMMVACVGQNVQRKRTPGLKETLYFTAFASVPDCFRDFLIQAVFAVSKIIWA